MSRHQQTLHRQPRSQLKPSSVKQNGKAKTSQAAEAFTAGQTYTTTGLDNSNAETFSEEYHHVTHQNQCKRGLSTVTRKEFLIDIA
jgi:hypothetical protein